MNNREQVLNEFNKIFEPFGVNIYDLEKKNKPQPIDSIKESIRKINELSKRLKND